MRSMVPSRMVAASLALAALACGPQAVSPEVAREAVSVQAIDPGNAGGNKFVTVMTRNLFVGGDILRPFTVPPDQAIEAAAQVWQDIQSSNFPLRAGGVADEIFRTSPDLVALQEVYRFEVTSLATAEPAAPPLDFLEELVAALAARGLSYGVVQVSPHTDLAVPFQELGVQVRLLDRDAILARLDSDVEIRGSSAGDFATRLSANLGGISFDLTRGFATAEVKKQGVPFLFATAHLEVRNISPLLPEGLVQAAQAQELLGVLGDRDRVILAGDFNSDPDHPIAYWSYGLFVGAGGLTDAWRELDAAGTGLTCCFEPARDPEAELYERIDLVLHRGANATISIERVGASPDALLHDALGPLWPSDHAGVVARIRLEDPRFVALE